MGVRGTCGDNRDNSGDSRIDAAEIWSTDSSNYVKRIQANNNRTHPVGGKKPNAWGLYDMHGNVEEWVQDWYDGDYYGTRPNPDTDPLGPNTGSGRVVRGGGWGAPAGRCRSAARLWFRPGYRGSLLGFRLLRQAR